ncbi:hypothetical protein CPB85DRAFT_781920 [Mucidula mucida]|nr:hypothetical protein CPB85DRAFT_781920 [Mucidula mucida]
MKKENRLDVFSRYSRSKLCSVLYMNILQARLDARSIPITCMSLHPGGVNTFAHQTPYPRIAAILMKLFLKGPDVGAYTSCFAAASPLIKEDPSTYKGQYLCPVGVISPKSQNRQRSDLGEELWNTTMAFFTDLGLLTDDLTIS